MKASPLIEALGLSGMFYKNKEIVFVKKFNRQIEKHYYEVTPKGKVLIYPDDKAEQTQNPSIKGKITVFDAKTKKLVLMWREGEEFAEPMFNTQTFGQKLITSEQDFEILALGAELEKLNNPLNEVARKEGLIMWLVIFNIIFTIFGLIGIILIAQNAGIKLSG